MSRPALSFEVFPPKSVPASFKLWDSLSRLQHYAPDFISVTYGAQGSTQDVTRDTALAIIEQTDLPVSAHLTAARASKADVLARAQDFADAGVNDIVALRGDAEAPGTAFAPHPEGFADSIELIEALAKTQDFKIRVGAYPETHPDSTSQDQNIAWLKAKLDAGADSAITQFFFEADTFLRFRDACADAGITSPIIPGILPISNWTRTRKFAEACGASVPAWLDQAFEKAIRDDREEMLSLAVTSELCSTLMDEGVDALHIYTLNTAHLTEKLCATLGITPNVPALRNVA